MGEERIASLLRWLSVAIVFLSASVVPNKLIYAALDFRVVAIRTLFSAALGGVVGITVAFIGGGAFAIIAQQIVSQAIINVIAWSNVRWRPTFTFDLKAIPECMGPGVKATGINIILFFEEQTPRVVIGALLGSVALGYYACALRSRSLQLIRRSPCSFPRYASLMAGTTHTIGKLSSGI
jgi:PST family polysaccharide transporter